MRNLFVVLVLFPFIAFAGSEDGFISFKVECENQGNAQACAAAGDHLWQNNGKKLQPCVAPASIVCQRSSEDKMAAVARIDELAFQYHSRACVQQQGEACNKAGVYFAVKYARAPDAEAPALAAKAEDFFKKACSLGSHEGCSNVGSTQPAK